MSETQAASRMGWRRKKTSGAEVPMHTAAQGRGVHVEAKSARQLVMSVPSGGGRLPVQISQ